MFVGHPSSSVPISLIARFPSFPERNNGILVFGFSPSVMLSSDFALFFIQSSICYLTSSSYIALSKAQSKTSEIYLGTREAM